MQRLRPVQPGAGLIAGAATGSVLALAPLVGLLRSPGRVLATALWISRAISMARATRRGRALAHRVDPQRLRRCRTPSVQRVLGVVDALAGAQERPRLAHSRYWKHCSRIAKSKLGASARACSRSFFSATARPAAWTARASQRLKRSWSRRGQREAAVVRVAVEVVGLDRVEPLRPAHRDPCAQDRREQRELADVEPALARPAVGRRAGVRESAVVRAPVLRRPGVEVADDVAPGAVESRHGARGASKPSTS